MFAVERSLWHPVIASAALTAARAEAVTLLGEAVVLWRDQVGAPRAFTDRCPHRGARLSLGRIVHTGAESRLECPYHGWQFDSSGQCRSVPALPEFVPPAKHRACAYEAREAYGLVWVCLRVGAIEVPPFLAWQDAALRKTLCGPYDVATSAPRIVENFLDMAHFGFVHEGLLGAREHPAIPDYRVEEDEQGFSALDCRATQPQSSVHATGSAEVSYTYHVNAPYTAVLTKAPDAGGAAIANFRESIALFVCPLEEEASRVWFVLAMNDFTSPDAKLQDFQHTIFMQDKPVLESQMPKRLPLAGDSELHSAADKASAAYRRYLLRQGVRFGVLP